MDRRADAWMDINWDNEEGSDLEEAAASEASGEVYVIFSVYDWSGALVYWAGTSEVESKKAWPERSLDFFEYGPDDVSNLIYARFSGVPIDVINGVCSKDRDTANCYLRILFGADPAEAADSDPNWDPDGCPFHVDILGEHNGIDAYYDLAALGYDVNNIENWPDNKFRDLIAKHHLNESDGHNKVLIEDDDIEEGFVEEAVDEEVAHSMGREELKQIIKQIIERDIKNGDWFDVDTIAYDVSKEYPDVKTDTDEFYDLEIEYIAEANEDAETEDDPLQYRIVKVSYCSDDYDINVEFGIIDPDEEEYDVVDQEWLLKPGQTIEDLENYLYDKEGVTNLDMGDPEVVTQDQAATEYKYSQKF